MSYAVSLYGKKGMNESNSIDLTKITYDKKGNISSKAVHKDYSELGGGKNEISLSYKYSDNQRERDSEIRIDGEKAATSTNHLTLQVNLQKPPCQW